MKNLLSLNEILGTIGDGETEVCATATADYSAAEEMVTVALDAFTRHSSPSNNGRHLPQPWLPAPEQVKEHLPREEADAFTHDVFQSWVRKVRASIPAGETLRM